MPPTHLVEADRLKAVLRHGPSNDSIETDIRQHMVVVDPGLAAVSSVSHFRSAISEPPRQTSGERVRRLDDVIVDGDQRVAAGGPPGGGGERGRALPARAWGG